MTDGDKYRGQIRKSRTQILNCNNLKEMEGRGEEERREGREKEN